jgi:hypothetical protein
MLRRDWTWTGIAALALACGPTSRTPSPQGSSGGLGGEPSNVVSAAGGASASSSGGTTSVAANGGAPATAGAASATTGLGAGGAQPSIATGGIPAGGAGGAVIGGAGGGSAGATSQAGPAPFEYSITIPSAAPGEEGTQCLQVQLPNTTPISVTKLHNVLSEGSHHFIVSAVNDPTATTMPATPCKPFRTALQGGPLAITQRKDDTVSTPPGVGYGLSANQIISLELHYINTDADMLSVEAHTQIFPAETGANLQDSTVLLIGTTNFSLAPQTTTSTGPRYIPMPAALDGVNYFAVTGHTHHLGTAVKVSTAASATATPAVLYAPAQYNWDSPTLEQLSPPVQVPSGGGFVLQCDWNNTTSSTITWGESALNEMCFFWAYYYPRKSVSNLILEGFGPVDPALIKTLGI